MIQKLIINFEPSKSKDVVGYILYIDKYPNEISYTTSNFDIELKTSIDLSEYINEEGRYNIGIAAKDKAGNISKIKVYNDISIISDVIENDDKKRIWIIVGIVIVLAVIGLGFWFFSR